MICSPFSLACMLSRSKSVAGGGPLARLYSPHARLRSSSLTFGPYACLATLAR
jgi:hypothetical protein